MILADVNVLVHAFRRDSPRHELCRSWLNDVLNSGLRYGVSPQVLSSVVRIVTHPNTYDPPSDLEDTLKYCEYLIKPESCQIVSPGDRHWGIFTTLCRQSDARGNLVADAWLAALAIEWGCEWITFDRDFARFSGLRWKVPEIP